MSVLAGILFALAGLAACREGVPSVSTEDVAEEHLTAPVALVNGAPVYESTYETILVAMRERIPEDHPDSIELYIGAKYRALEKAIDEELLLQEAVRRGYEPSRDEIGRLYREQVEKIGSEEEYLAGARLRRLSKSEVLEAVRREVALGRFVSGEIESGLTATESEARAFYDVSPDLFTPETWIRVAQISVVAPLDLPLERRAEALSRLSVALERLEQGESFETLAREISEDGSARGGGMLGYVRKGDLREELDRVAFTLGPGEVSEIIDSIVGYHLLKVYERTGGTVRPFEEVKEEAREKLLARMRSEKLRELIETLREEAEIERLMT